MNTTKEYAALSADLSEQSIYACWLSKIKRSRGNDVYSNGIPKYVHAHKLSMFNTKDTDETIVM